MKYLEKHMLITYRKFYDHPKGFYTTANKLRIKELDGTITTCNFYTDVLTYPIYYKKPNKLSVVCKKTKNKCCIIFSIITKSHDNNIYLDGIFCYNRIKNKITSSYKFLYSLDEIIYDLEDKIIYIKDDPYTDSNRKMMQQYLFNTKFINDKYIIIFTNELFVYDIYNGSRIYIPEKYKTYVPESTYNDDEFIFIIEEYCILYNIVSGYDKVIESYDAEYKGSHPSLPIACFKEEHTYHLIDYNENKSLCKIVDMDGRFIKLTENYLIIMVRNSFVIYYDFNGKVKSIKYVDNPDSVKLISHICEHEYNHIFTSYTKNNELLIQHTFIQ